MSLQGPVTDTGHRTATPPAGQGEGRSINKQGGGGEGDLSRKANAAPPPREGGACSLLGWGSLLWREAGEKTDLSWEGQYERKNAGAGVMGA